MENIRLIELFAGYGSQAMALKRAGVPFTHHKVVEFDKYAIASYNAVHGTNFPTMDITKVHAQDLEIVDTNKYTYLLTYSFPCTDLSTSGKMQGMKKGSGTRSGLLWEVERILEECKDNLPQYLLMENVTQVHGEQNISDFTEWIKYLASKGYKSKWQDLNAKDYGIPQNRERCFMVSYLDKSTRFEFPLPFKLQNKIVDLLEPKVDKKYYLSSKRAQELLSMIDINQDITREGIDLTINNPQIKDISNCIAARDRGVSKLKSEGTGVIEKIVAEERKDEGIRTFNDNCIGTLRTIDSCGDKRVIEKTVFEERRDKGYQTLSNEVIGCLRTIDSGGDKRVIERDYLPIKQGTKRGYVEAYPGDYVNLQFSTSETRRGRVGKGLAHTLLCNDSQGVVTNNLRIRKLTPLECYRLMGVSDEDAYKMMAINSNTQCYKQAGNSIVVDVMVEIFKNLFLGGSDKIPSQMDIDDFL